MGFLGQLSAPTPSFGQFFALPQTGLSPAGTGSAQIRCKIAPNTHLVRWPPASSQSDRACLTSRPPVFTNRRCKLVCDQGSILFGSTCRRTSEDSEVELKMEMWAQI